MSLQEFAFHPLTVAWFIDTFGEPTETQRAAWPVIAADRNALVIAHTGTGKTLAAFLFAIDRLIREAESGSLPNETRVLYITPLKALGNDIALNLDRPLSGIRQKFGEAGISLPDIRTAIRHGDTPQSARTDMTRKPPHILITTPESLFLMLTGANSTRMLSTVETVIVDELHAVLATKRGASLSLSLERLAAVCAKPPQRIGLSATLALPEVGASFLSGAEASGAARTCEVVVARARKDTDIRVEKPQMGNGENSVWPSLLREAYAAVRSHTSTLIFVNGRATAEKMAAGLTALATGDLEYVTEAEDEGKSVFARTHHGSLSREARHEAERLFKNGKLKCLCATGSMELGIDIGDIDLVIQVGSVPTIANGLQRLGRAGHAPGKVSVMRMLARTARDALDGALSAKEMLSGHVEPEHPPELCLDVLAQHLLSMVWREPKQVDELLAMTRGAWGYRALSRDSMTDVLRMLAGDFERTELRPVRPRLYYDAINDRVSGDAYTRMLACAASTIPDRGLFAVYLEENNARLGELDEECVFEARVGDRFMLGASSWQITRIDHDRVLVKHATREGAGIPFWKGEGFGRSYSVGKRMGENMRAMEEEAASGKLARLIARDFSSNEDAVREVAKMLADQIDEAGALPTDRRIVIEHFATESGYDAMMVHSMFGGRVHAALSMLIRDSLERERATETLAFYNDTGMLFTAVGSAELPDNVFTLLYKYHLSNELNTDSTRGLVGALTAVLPGTPLFGVSFRHAAARAMLFGAHNGRRQPLWIQRERGARALDAALKHPNHPLLQETLRECLVDQMDVGAAAEVLGDIQNGRIAVTDIHTDKPSPLAVELMFEFAGYEMYDYDPTPDSAKAARLSLGQSMEPALASLRPPELAALEEASPKPKIASADALHAWLLTGGDATADELPSHDEACESWLDELVRTGRVAYIEPGIWIAAEQAGEYAAALAPSAEDGEQKTSISRLVERRLRFRGGMSAEQLEGHYTLPVSDTLAALAAAGRVIEYQNIYWHADNYRAAGARTRAALRESVRTAQPQAYAALLAARHLPPSGADRLERALSMLACVPIPIDRLEREILPVRVPKYRPAMLDALLASGRFTWRAERPANEDDPPLIIFTETTFDQKKSEDADSSDTVSDPLSEAEERTLAALRAKGAMFGAALSVALGFEAREALLSLTARGLATNDSIAPMRAIITPQPRARQKLLSQAGRWSALPPRAIETIELRLERAFHRWGIVCKETCGPETIPWGEALERLRVWEYTGIARRGYFVRGLSGAQFALDAEFVSITAALGNPRDDVIVLPANDPAQAWGRVLPHHPDRRFMILGGTAVVTRSGLVDMISDRHGEAMRWFDNAESSLAALVRAYRAERIYTNKQRLSVKQYPDGGELLLKEAGFADEGGAFTLWRTE